MSDNLPPLLPCPFCGNDKNINMANEKHDHSGGYFISCPACDSSTGLRYAMGDDPRPLLVEQWNRRAAIEANTPAVPDMNGGGLVAIKTLLSRDPCAHASTAIAMIDVMLAAPQPQPVAQPSECEWTNCPRRVGDVCCNQQKE